MSLLLYSGTGAMKYVSTVQEYRFCLCCLLWNPTRFGPAQAYLMFSLIMPCLLEQPSLNVDLFPCKIVISNNF
jgi:hypothetical protein